MAECNLEEKRSNDKKYDQVTTYNNGKETYHIGDTVYIESQRSDMPYYICAIRDFKKTKKENVSIDVVWFYRPCEIPTSVYQLLLQDRNAENGSADNILESPVVKERELFISDAVDIYPVSALRGRASCVPFSEIKENIMNYIGDENNWFYILRYNPESRRMANAKGEIRIGASHQAILPPYVPFNLRTKCELKELKQTCLEELVWEPTMSTSKLMFYLMAARSITSYNGYRDKDEGGPNKALESFSQDNTTAHSYDILHQLNYNISDALQELFKNPISNEPSNPWTDEERKKFMKGLRSYGKTFHKIRKELLPNRLTSELVKYYYIWKKTSSAINSRPHKRGNRRNNNLVRKTRTTKPKATVASEFLDLSSCSESEFAICDDSENERNLSLYACRHCYTTKSSSWHHAGKLKLLLCDDCRIHFKRYGRMRTLEGKDKREPPTYIYKAAFANLEEQLQYTGRMRTRRSSTPIFTSVNSVRSRILQEAKLCNRKQVTAANKSDDQDAVKHPAKRRSSNEENEGDAETPKKARLEGDAGEEADDESDGESESEIRSDSTGQISNHSSPPTKPVSNTFVPIKEEEVEEESSPDVPDNLEKCEKISQRFKYMTSEASSARCAMIYVFKRGKQDADKNREEHFERFREREHGSPPMRLQPAKITSHYETMRLFAARNEPQRNWHPAYPADARSPRTMSPREYLNDPSGKFNHLMKMFERQPPEHRSAHAPLHPNAHPHHHSFAGRSAEHDFRSASARSHISSHVPAAIENLSRIPSGLESMDRAPGLDRPPAIDPATGLPPIQPHLHSHLHTHTHLHVHPEDLKYRGRNPPPEAAHHERHERTAHPPQPPLPQPHRPRDREYHEHLLKQYPELLAQMHHESQIREPFSRHLPVGREGIHPASREGAVSPSIPHESPNMHSDPVAYHLWLTQYTRMHQRWSSHSGVPPPHGQAPDLSPHGIPPQHPHHIRSEHEKIMHEKLLHEKIINAEREKIARSVEHEKYMRHILKSREHEKFKVEHNMQERPPSLRAAEIHSAHRPSELHSTMRPSDVHRSMEAPHRELHTAYHNSMFMENLRRVQDIRSSHHERTMHERYAHERMSHMERHSERAMYHDRTRHERPSIFGHYKPETIDLSEE